MRYILGLFSFISSLFNFFKKDKEEKKITIIKTENKDEVEKKEIEMINQNIKSIVEVKAARKEIDNNIEEINQINQIKDNKERRKKLIEIYKKMGNKK
jgi:ABC-type oligopeptide transport system ATPase subunit